MKKRLCFCLFLCILLCPPFCKPIVQREGAVRFKCENKARPADVLFDDGALKKGFRFFYENSYYALFLDENQIAALDESAQKYFLDFQKKRLSKKKSQRKNQDALKKYGPVNATLLWGEEKEALTRSAALSFWTGYSFASGSPYFCIYVQSVKNQGQEGQGRFLENSGDLLLEFTKSQISDLIIALKED